MKIRNIIALDLISDLSIGSERQIKLKLIRLCKWLKQLDSKLSPVKGFMGSNPLSIAG